MNVPFLDGTGVVVYGHAVGSSAVTSTTMAVVPATVIPPEMRCAKRTAVLPSREASPATGHSSGCGAASV